MATVLHPLTGLAHAVVPSDEGVVGVTPGPVLIAIWIPAVALLRVNAQHRRIRALGGTKTRQDRYAPHQRQAQSARVED